MEEEKKGFKAWFLEKKESAKKFCKEHPDVVLTVIGGVASIVGGALKIYANRSEFEDNLFTEIDGQVYKIPAKEMKTAKYLKEEE